ncbi:MAG: DUF58 domain-containing protein [Verrucomicrobiota bacterium]
MPATSPSARRDRFLDPKALMAIRHLELRARVVVEGFWNGLHRSPYHGFSVEFTEYRQYTPGDDPRYLDWRLFARSDRYYLKKFEDETNLRCHLLVDFSRSMNYGSLGFTKSDYARTLAATLAWFLNGQGDAVGLFTFADRLREFLPARHRHGHLRQIMRALDQETTGDQTRLDETLRRVAELTRKRGLVVLISDLLAPAAELAASLGQLAGGGHEVVVFQILDPKELDFDFPQAAYFHDVESGRNLHIDPAVARAGYQEQLRQHTESVTTLCHQLGFGFHRVVTDQPLPPVLLEFLKGRARRGKLLRRQHRASGRARPS